MRSASQLRRMSALRLGLWLLLLAAPLGGWLAVARAQGSGTRWYRGNTHAHTELCGHADSSPAAVASWYLEHGYHFLVLSEHNKFIDPKTVELPKERRRDFILVPGEEVTGKNGVHTTAMNIRGLVNWRTKRQKVSEVVQLHVDRVRKAGGTPILSHPNFRWAVSAADMERVKRLHHFELYNGHPSARNFGDARHPSTEKLWDLLLTKGRRLYAVASDDAHTFKKMAAKHSNPGRGWVMVRASKLTPAAIQKALKLGDFYATSGVILKRVERGRKSYEIEVDEAKTEKELASLLLMGRAVKTGEPGTFIVFVGPGGVELKTVVGAKASFEPRDRTYVRARVTVRRRAKKGLFEYYAWTQPVFKRR